MRFEAKSAESASSFAFIHSSVRPQSIFSPLPPPLNLYRLSQIRHHDQDLVYEKRQCRCRQEEAKSQRRPDSCSKRFVSGQWSPPFNMDRNEEAASDLCRQNLSNLTHKALSLSSDLITCRFTNKHVVLWPMDSLSLCAHMYLVFSLIRRLG